jgi:hypothetical protein
MVIYAKQDNFTSCGPTALGNALKFLEIGNYHRFKDLLKKITKYRPREGVWLQDIHQAGKKLSKKHGFRFSRMPQPSFKKMVNALQDGYGLIASFQWIPKKGGHLVFVHGIEAGNLLTANDTIQDYYESSVTHRLTSRSIWKSRLKRGGFTCWKVSF